MKTVRVGLVGLGLVSDSHAAGYQQHEGAKIQAVCDVNRAVAERKANLWKASKVYTDFDEMIRDPEIDAVDIMTPPNMHHRMAISAAACGKHVNCEKPFCNSVKEGREMTRSAEEAGVVLAVDESYLFTTAHMRARELIESGVIGDPRQIRHYKGSYVQREEGLIDRRRLLETRQQGESWRADPVRSGGGSYPWVFDHAVHLFALTQYLMLDLEIDSLFGIPATYPGKAGKDDYTSEDNQDIPIITWQFKDPQKQGLWVRAEKRAHDIFNNRKGFSTVVLGTEGMIEVLGEGGSGLIVDGVPAHMTVHREGEQIETVRFEGESDRIWDSEVSYYDQAHINEVMHFTDCILNGATPRYGGAEGTREIGLTLATIESATRGRPMKLNDLSDDHTAYG